MVIKPMPPIWMRQRMTIWPNRDQCVKVSCTISPVTQEADTVVNRASIKDALPEIFEAEGMMSSNVPMRMTARYPSTSSRTGVSRIFRGIQSP